jgi:hypothetical protein
MPYALLLVIPFTVITFFAYKFLRYLHDDRDVLLADEW